MRIEPIIRFRRETARQRLAADPVLHQNDGVAEPQHIPDRGASRRRRQLQVQGAIEKIENAGTLAALIAPGLPFPHLHFDGRIVLLAPPDFGDVGRSDVLDGRIGAEQLPLRTDAAAKAFKTFDDFLRRRPRRGRRIERFESSNGIRETARRVGLQSVLKPVMQRLKRPVAIDRGVPVRRIAGRGAVGGTPEQNLMSRDRGQEHVLGLGAEIVAENVFGRGHRREELIARLAERGDFGELRRKQMRNPDGRRRFEPHTVASQIQMRRLGGMKRGNAREYLAREFDPILGRKVGPFAGDEIAQPLQAPPAVVDLPIVDALIGVGRLRNENPILAIFVPIAEIVEDFAFPAGNLRASFLGLKSPVLAVREIPQPQGPEILRRVLFFRLILPVDIVRMLEGGLIRRGDIAIVARAPGLERSRFDVEELEETILPDRAGQRVRHDLRGHVAEGRAARLLRAERLQEVVDLKNAASFRRGDLRQVRLAGDDDDPDDFRDRGALAFRSRLQLRREQTQNIFDVAVNLGDGRRPGIAPVVQPVP